VWGVGGGRVGGREEGKEKAEDYALHHTIDPTVLQCTILYFYTTQRSPSLPLPPLPRLLNYLIY
jgi:hypothetical protein